MTREDPAMTAELQRQLRNLEGHRVYLALTDGSRIDDADLVSARRKTIWVFCNGEDAILRADEVIDVWEAQPLRPAA